MKKIVLILFGLMLVNLVSADIIIQEVSESSNIQLGDNLDIELMSAIVNISVHEYSGSLSAYFEVYSNEDEPINATVYLKAKGRQCYGGCQDIDPVLYETFFNVNSNNPAGNIGGRQPDGAVSSSAELINTSEGIFAGVNFILLPNQVNKINVYQNIYFPFEYYLDSLLTFKKANYEKITIKSYADGVNVNFNEHYPVQKVDTNTWVWEYSNLDVRDENLKDVLVIDMSGGRPNPDPTPNPPPNPSNNWIYYFCGIVVIILLLLVILKIKKSRTI